MANEAQAAGRTTNERKGQCQRPQRTVAIVDVAQIRHGAERVVADDAHHRYPDPAPVQYAGNRRGLHVDRRGAGRRSQRRFRCRFTDHARDVGGANWHDRADGRAGRGQLTVEFNDLGTVGDARINDRVADAQRRIERTAHA